MEANSSFSFSNFTKYKKQILVFLIFVLFFLVTMCATKNFNYPKVVFPLIGLTTIIGILVIPYVFNNKDNLHKVAFVLILVFGILLVFLAPAMDFPDEAIHFTRAEFITEGVLYPVETVDGFYIDSYYFDLNQNPWPDLIYGRNVMGNVYLTHTINDQKGFFPICTSTPFYSYVFSAVGIFLAKCLNSLAIFAVWFGRLGNLLFYAAVAAFSIKKAPKYKMALTVFATLPLSIAIAASLSYDCFIIAFVLLIFAYFIKMMDSEVKIQDIAIFLIACFLISIIKQPYALLAFLILFIPKKNFTSKGMKYAARIGFLIFVLLIGISVLIRIPSFVQLITGTAPSTPIITTTNSAIAGQPTSISGQLVYLLSHPSMFLEVIWCSIKYIPKVFVTELSVYHWGGFKGIKFYNILVLLFLFLFALFYKQDIKLSKKRRIFALLIFLLTYVGFYFVMYMTWTPVGYPHVLGVQARYFLPVVPLIPLILNVGPDKLINLEKPKFIKKVFDNVDLWVLTSIIIFCVGLILLTLTHYY